jgi:hypothetical protein
MNNEENKNIELETNNSIKDKKLREKQKNGFEIIGEILGEGVMEPDNKRYIVSNNKKNINEDIREGFETIDEKQYKEINKLFDNIEKQNEKTENVNTRSDNTSSQVKELQRLIDQKNKEWNEKIDEAYKHNDPTIGFTNIPKVRCENGRNELGLKYLSLGKCATYCKENPECISFEHDEKTGRCLLSSSCFPGNAIPENFKEEQFNRKVVENFDIYMKDGYRVPKLSNFKKIENKICIDNIHFKHYPKKTINECADIAYNNKDAISFHYNEKNKACYLSKKCHENRSTAVYRKGHHFYERTDKNLSNIQPPQPKPKPKPKPNAITSTKCSVSTQQIPSNDGLNSVPKIQDGTKNEKPLIQVYEHNTGRGESKGFRVSIRNINKELGVLRYKMSSAKVAKGYKVIFFQNAEYEGRYFIIGDNNKETFMKNFNDLKSNRCFNYRKKEQEHSCKNKKANDNVSSFILLDKNNKPITGTIKESGTNKRVEEILTEIRRSPLKEREKKIGGLPQERPTREYPLILFEGDNCKGNNISINKNRWNLDPNRNKFRSYKFINNGDPMKKKVGFYQKKDYKGRYLIATPSNKCINLKGRKSNICINRNKKDKKIDSRTGEKRHGCKNKDLNKDIDSIKFFP